MAHDIQLVAGPEAVASAIFRLLGNLGDSSSILEIKGAAQKPSYLRIAIGMDSPWEWRFLVIFSNQTLAVP